MLNKKDIKNATKFILFSAKRRSYRKILQYIMDSLTSIQQLTGSPPTFYPLFESEIERTFIKNNFGYMKDDRLRHLLKSLDAESSSKIINIVKNIELILANDCIPLDLFSHKEKNDLLKLYDLYQRKLIKLEDDVYAFENKLLGVNYFGVSVFIAQHGVITLSEAQRKDINTGTIIDVGGFIGDSSLVFSHLFPQSKICSFEALPDNIKMFKKTIELNSLSNVEIIEKALGDSVQKLPLSNFGDASSLLCAANVNNVVVDITTLDNIVDEYNLDKIKLIKVDIEGFEQKFLCGARNTIEKHRPIMLLSIYHNYDDFVGILPLVESFSLNYKFRIFKHTDGLALGETLLICEPQ